MTYFRNLVNEDTDNEKKDDSKDNDNNKKDKYKDNKDSNGNAD